MNCLFCYGWWVCWSSIRKDREQWANKNQIRNVTINIIRIQCGCNSRQRSQRVEMSIYSNVGIKMRALGLDWVLFECGRWYIDKTQLLSQRYPIIALLYYLFKYQSWATIIPTLPHPLPKSHLSTWPKLCLNFYSLWWPSPTCHTPSQLGFWHLCVDCWECWKHPNLINNICNVCS